MNSPPPLITASRERIDQYLPVAPAHMRPIMLAVRDFGAAWATIPQRVGRFDIPSDKPFIAIIGDDLHEALGPAGFHRKSVRRLLASCRFISIVACEPLVLPYAAAASCAVGLGKNAVVIETRPEFELQWLDLAKREAPEAQYILGSVKERGH